MVTSAEREAQLSLLTAAEHERIAASERSRGLAYLQAVRSEAQTLHALAPLESEGWRLLPDRHWPGTRRANIDLVAVGPGGLVVVDSKDLSGSIQVRGGSLWQGQAERDDELEGVRAQRDAVLEALGEAAPTAAASLAVLCFTGCSPSPCQLRGVHPIPVTDLLRLLRAQPRRLDPGEVAVLAAELERELPPALAPVTVPLPRRTVVPLPVVLPLAAELFDADALSLAELEAAATQPVEEWMTWLAPDQRALSRRSTNGPSRIRGSAGTGKTVVGLHRLAALAERSTGPLLWVTYVKTLPGVLATLYRRLSPGTAPRVEFTGLHALAVRLLWERGQQVALTRDETAFNIAWLHTRDGLEDLRGRDYWRDEVSAVIKARGLTVVEDYLSLQRTGRVTPLPESRRRSVWRLYEAYTAELRRRGEHDYEDLLTLALLAVRQAPPLTSWSAVVVDEAQDLTRTGLELLHALAGDRPDGLTLIGDSAQSVYAGGCTLREAGISVSGRSAVLRVNYRNTSEVLTAAFEILADASGDDLEELAESVEVTARRSGPPPVRVTTADRASHDAALLAALRRTVRAGARLGSLAVLCRTKATASSYERLLRQERWPVVPLTEYDGTQREAVKVGTVKRAKGLEFGHVYRPLVHEWRLAAAEDPERQRLDRRELFVALTRARDTLWLGAVSG